MSTKKKFYLSVCAAIYGFLSPFIDLFIFASASPYGFDTPATEGTLIIVAIDLIIGVVGIIMAFVYSRRLTNEKLSQLSEIPVANVCNYCKINVADGVDICPNCGNKIK